MKSISKVAIGALTLAGSIMAIGAPAQAQSVYFGADSGGGVYGGYDSGAYADPYYSDPYADPYYDAYAADPYGSDPYACSYYDYYEPPWGYPPDYCNYQVWTQPV